MTVENNYKPNQQWQTFPLLNNLTEIQKSPTRSPAEVVDEFVVDPVQILDPFKQALELKGQFLGQIPLIFELDQDPLSLLCLKLLSANAHLVYLFRSDLLSLGVLASQLENEHLQLLYLPSEGARRVGFVTEGPELFGQQIFAVLELSNLQQVGLGHFVALFAAAQGFHEVDCRLVGVVGPFSHFLNLTYQLAIILSMEFIHQFLQTFVYHYLWYHAINLTIVLTIASLILLHRKGSERNLQIAKQYKQILDPLLKKTFDDYDGQLVIESPNIIKMYASGWSSCLFAIFAFGLVPRQQIISFLFNSLFIKLKDQLVIEIPILNDQPISLTMAIISRKQIKTLTKKKYPDIKQLCKEYKPIVNTHCNVPDTHSILIEKVEHYKYLLYSEEDIQVWKEYGKYVKMVYMSDVNRYSRYPMTVRMVLQLGEGVGPLVQWMLNYVDRMAKIRMSSGERREARKRREGLDFKVDI